MAFRIAVSGLRAATADLDVTGNNIANSNTTGFKSSRAQFADVYAATSIGTSQDSIGQGVSLAAVAQQFGQGTISFTDNSLDLAISGEGFFVLEDTTGAQLYSRAGAFGVDENGVVVNSLGQRLVAFQATGGTLTGVTGPLQLSSSNIAPQATGLVDVGVNLDADAVAPAIAFDPLVPASYNNATSLTVYDSLGQDHLATVYFRKTASNTWDSHLVVGDPASPLNAGSAVGLAFDATGQLTTGMPIRYQAAPGFDPLTGANLLDLQFDFSPSTQFGGQFGVNTITQDGFATGRLSGVDIDEQGVVLARFTNGQSQIQGQVALANFSNPQGLQPLGDTAWAETNSSGAALVGGPGTASLGLVQSGALEESNVDLAEQLVNMIVAQRNFQANAQMIRSEDEIIQTIVNIR
jgi:flagellar hook protein FlgE